MKLIIKIALLVLLISLIITLIPSRTISQSQKDEALFSFGEKDSVFSLKIREKEKEELKNIVKKVKNLIYWEATIHNPEGDVVPDQIDDKIIQEVKEKVN